MSMAVPEKTQGIHLEPPRPRPLKDQVARELRRIIEQHLQPGDQLMSERELSERLQVSRGTVREAVQFLHALGLVEVRHGSGTFVRAAHSGREELRAQWRQWTIRHAERIHELLEVRRGLESFAAELAAARLAGRGDRAMVEALAQMAAAAAASDVAAAVEADALFHHALCEATGNPTLVELDDTLCNQLVQERAATWDLPGRAQRSIEEHSAIYEAIRGRDAGAARAAVIAHLASVERDLQRAVFAERRKGDRHRSHGRAAT